MAILQNAINANSITPLLLIQGGSGASLSASNGGIVWSNDTQFQILAGTATANQLLLSGASGTPAWSTATYLPTLVANELMFASATNVMAQVTAADSAVLVSSSAGVPSWSAPMTNGEIIIGSTGATPVAAALIAGTGITITNGAGTITIANSETGVAWQVVTTDQTLAPGKAFAANSASPLTFTLPASAAVGDTYQVMSMNTGGFASAQGAGQQIFCGNVSDTLGATGTVTSANTTGDWIEIVCMVANTVFWANEKQGAFNYA